MLVGERELNLELTIEERDGEGVLATRRSVLGLGDGTSLSLRVKDFNLDFDFARPTVASNSVVDAAAEPLRDGSGVCGAVGGADGVPMPLRAHAVLKSGPRN